MRLEPGYRRGEWHVRHRDTRHAGNSSNLTFTVNGIAHATLGNAATDNDDSDGDDGRQAVEADHNRSNRLRYLTEALVPVSGQLGEERVLRAVLDEATPSAHGRGPHPRAPG